MKKYFILIAFIALFVLVASCKSERTAVNQKNQENQQQQQQSGTDEGVKDNVEQTTTVDVSDKKDHYGGVSQSGTVGLIYAYSPNEGGYVVRDYIGSDSNVKISEEYNGKPVIAIGENCFKNNLTITSLSISKNIQRIDYYAFSRAFNLKDISIDKGNSYLKLKDGIIYSADETIIYGGEAGRYISFSVPETVTKLTPGCFGNFDNLTFLRLNPETIPVPYSYDSDRHYCSTIFNRSIANSYLTLDKMLNSYVPVLKTIEIYGITYVPYYFLSYCPTVQNVYLSDSVTTIKAYAFSDCPNLRIVEAPNVTSVGDYSFRNCLSLAKIYFGKEVTFGSYMFNGCSYVLRLFFAGNYQIQSNDYFKYDGDHIVNRSIKQTYETYLNAVMLSAPTITFKDGKATADFSA